MNKDSIIPVGLVVAFMSLLLLLGHINGKAMEQCLQEHDYAQCEAAIYFE